MTLALRYPGLRDLFVLLAGINLLEAGYGQFGNDPGVGWHLQTGKLVTQGKFPYFDPFLVHEVPRRWISDQWLADTLGWILYSLGGWAGCLGLTAALFLALYWFLLPRAAEELGADPLGVTLITVLAFKLGQIHFILRPVVLSFPLFFGVLWATLAVSGGRLAGNYRSTLFTTGAFFVAWANLHPSFVLGFLVLGLGALFTSLRQGMSERTSLLLVMLLVAVVVTLVNPNGFELHRSILALGQSKYFMALNSEWIGVSWGSPEFEFLLVGLVVILVLWGFMGRGTSSELTAISVVTLFAVLSLSAVRFLPYFGIALVLAFGTLQKSPTGTSLVARIWNRCVSLEQGSARGNLGVVVAIVFLGVHLGEPAFGTMFPRVSMVSFQDAGRPRGYPDAALAKICADPSKENIIIAAPPDWGGAIAWHCYPAARGILDDRNSLNGEALYRKYLGAFAPGGSWEKMLREFKADWLVWPRESKLVAEFSRSKDLEKFFEDESSITYRVINEVSK